VSYAMYNSLKTAL